MLFVIVYIGRCPPYIKSQTTLTYTVCLFRPLYLSYKKKFLKNYKKIRSKKMSIKWIHKGNVSRPDKRTLKKGGKKK